MAWVATPTFSTDDVLSASNLNILSNDLEWLHGYVTGQNPAMAAVQLSTDGGWNFAIRHKHNYLHARYECQNDFEIFYNGISVFSDGSPTGSSADDTGPIDLSGYGFTLGALYVVTCAMDSGTIYWMYESDS